MVLSIIIPTYNMEAYLPRCLSSFITNDNKLMELVDVLVVIDGCTDRSADIAREYEKRYPHIYRVIEKENGNYGSCINAALPFAVGKFVKVLDADDYMNTDMLCQYLKCLDSLDVDLVFNNMDIVNRKQEKTGEWRLQLPERQVLSFEEICKHTRDFYVHKFAYRTSLLRDIGYRQTEGIFYSDNDWVAKPMVAVNSAYYIPLSIYNYNRDREGQSISKETKGKSLSSLKTMIMGLGQLWDSYNGEALRKQCLYQLFMKQISYVYNEFIRHQYYDDMEFGNFDKELLQCFPDLRTHIDESVRIHCLLFDLQPIPYWRDRNTLILWVLKLGIKVVKYWRRLRNTRKSSRD